MLAIRETALALSSSHVLVAHPLLSVPICNMKMMYSNLTMTESLQLETFARGCLHYHVSTVWFGETHREQLAVLLYFTRIKLSPVPSGLFLSALFVSSQLARERMWVINKRCGGFNLASQKILFSNVKPGAERGSELLGWKERSFFSVLFSHHQPQQWWERLRS